MAVRFIYHQSIINKNKLCLVLIIIILLITVSCITDKIGLNQTEINKSISGEPDLIDESIGTCPGRYICISSTVSAYQDKNCKIINRTTCNTECSDGLCKEKEIKICTSGFKCRNQYERAFQRESCRWEKSQRCEFGCNLQTTKCYNQSQTNQTFTITPASPSAVVSSTAPKSSYPVIKWNQTVKVGGGNLTIHAIETDRVQLKLNSQKSEWLMEGEKYNFKGDIILSVREILFQAYEGGKKEVVYSVD